MPPTVVRVCEECKAECHWRDCQRTMKEKLEDQWWKGTVFENNHIVMEDDTVREDVFWYYVCYKCIAKEKGVEDSAGIRIVRGDRSQKKIQRSQAWYENYSFIRGAGEGVRRQE